MAYIDRSLAQGERVRYRAKMHWVLWVRAWASLIVLGVLVIGLVLFVGDVVRLTTTEVAITSRRLVLKRGLLARHTSELELDSVEVVNLNQDVWGRLFGWGRLEVHGTGDDVWTSPLIAAPLRFRRELETAIDLAGRCEEAEASVEAVAPRQPPRSAPAQAGAGT